MADNHPMENDNAADAIETLGRKADQGKHAFQQWLKELSTASASQQMAVGASCGWVSGFVFKKVGRLAALGLGCGLILLQVAQHYGYVRLNWGQMQRDIRNWRDWTIQNGSSGQLSNASNKLQEFCKKNVRLASSFAIGFLIGIGF